MKREFGGRDFDKIDVEGYQLRVPRDQIAVRPPWSREQLLLNPKCRYPLSSSGYLWPSAVSAEDAPELEDPVVGLILPYALPLALAAADVRSCELLFQRLIAIHSIGLREPGRHDINVSVPYGFELCGFEITNSWWGQSPISASGHSKEDWKELRSIAGGHVNEWNLLDDFAIAHRLATLCSERDPIHGPFRAVLFATATPATRHRLAAMSI
jgi:hypothetical protein